MNTFLRAAAPYPHELVFGGFLVITWARLSANAGAGSAPALIFLGLILACVAVALYAIRTSQDIHAKWRLFLYVILMVFVFFQMKGVVPLIHEGKEDGLLQGWDTAIVGGNLSLVLEPYVSPILTEVMSICYALFFPYLFVSCLWYIREPLPLAVKFYTGIFVLYGVGFLGYTLVPALGPYIAMADMFAVPLQGYWITDLNAFVYPWGTNGSDVFPSLHVALSAYMLFFDLKHKRWRFFAYLLPCIGLWISTVYLRYHYFVDVIAGFALAAISLYVAFSYSYRVNKSPMEGKTEKALPLPTR